MSVDSAVQPTINPAKPWFSDEDLQFILGEVPSILRGQMTMGRWVAEFEKLTATMAGTRHALVTHSCTAALEIALKSLGIGAGDEVLVPVQTFMASATSVRNIGARPVFCDIRAATHCLDPVDAAARVTPHTRAIILVHYGGLITPDLEAIEELCRARGLFLIEDAAHAQGARKGNRFAGGIGNVGCFSFYATKVVTTGGEGGAVTLNDEAIAARARCYQHRGQDLSIDEEQIFVLPGHNVRMTEFQALCGVSQLRRLEEFITRRIEIAQRYNAALRTETPEVELIEPAADTRHAYWKHTFNLPPDVSRARLRAAMAERFQVPIAWSYFPAIHLQPVFRRLYDTYDGMLPVAEDVTQRLVNFPMHVRLTDSDVDRVLESFFMCYRELRGSHTPDEQPARWS
jgi:dTDP-4-amino-4,6-dideoxygalactose transaminase